MSERFVSYSRNGEDVVLRRALRGISDGRYLEVGADDPTARSVTRAFYDLGWSGLTVEPSPVHAAAHRIARPRDRQVEAAAGPSRGPVVLPADDRPGPSAVRADLPWRSGERGPSSRELEVTQERLDDVLAEAGWDGVDIHFAVVDVDGAESAVLAGLDLRRWRPWVLVVQDAAPAGSVAPPASWEAGVLEAGYRFCQFDGRSRFYAAEERADELARPLSCPAGAPGVVDDYDRIGEVELREQLHQAQEDALRWRATALERWVTASAASNADVDGLRNHARYLEEELAAIRETISWRVTRPLRWVRARQVREGATA